MDNEKNELYKLTQAIENLTDTIYLQQSRSRQTVTEIAEAMQTRLDAMMKQKNTDAQPNNDALLNRIHSIAKDGCLDNGKAFTQFVSLWTAYCIMENLECDTFRYDTILQGIWNSVRDNCKDLFRY